MRWDNMLLLVPGAFREHPVSASHTQRIPLLYASLVKIHSS